LVGVRRQTSDAFDAFDVKRQTVFDGQGEKKAVDVKLGYWI